MTDDPADQGWLPPEREQTVRQVRRLLDRVCRQDGTAHLLHLALTEQAALAANATAGVETHGNGPA
ncbi:hypothetical protein [Nonomuraea sp. NPDC049695]|uniref:hypothetical protein n=1 Tax=Nonomuraea sp. NPDC049695 TaxID=3154734 RepID=UPI00342899BE